MTTVISVENLSKIYRLGQIGTGTFANDLKVWWAKTRGKPNPLLKIGEADHGNQDGEDLWALRDVSFTVEQGEVLGIIGRNGAGKSTLLKILSRVTAPTSGSIKVKGRVASLLEVGTGFHPELTGRENIYLNGAILGMTKQEVTRKFDEIVDFAGVEKFIDTPVKRYSSGMYVRLAFAVAAHLEPEILVVDEVLAVGDAEFQKKCIGKMGDVAKHGRTVLFVSHNMAVVQTLCQKGILLSRGTVVNNNEIQTVVSSYIAGLEAVGAEKVLDRKDRRGRGDIRLVDINISAINQKTVNQLVTGSGASFKFQFNKATQGLTCRFTIYDAYKHPVVHFNSDVEGPEDIRENNQSVEYACEIEELALSPGRYWVNVLVLARGELQDHIESAAFFDVEAGPVRGRPISQITGIGNVCLPHKWIT